MTNALEYSIDYPYTSGSDSLNGNCNADLSLGVAKVSEILYIG
jgi:hypothetical protein